jgi:1,4-dihydroxy-2-naphthoyl-CoA hydrolase
MAWTRDDETEWTRTNPFRTHLGVQIESVRDDGEVEISIPVTDNLLQAAGVVHGGICCTLIDTALGTAVRAALQRPVKMSTIDLNVSFLRPGGGGRLYCRGRIIKSGKRVMVGTADVFDEANRMLATGRGSFMISE